MEAGIYRGIVARALRQARFYSNNATQEAFARLVGEELGAGPIARQQWSGWESEDDQPRGAILLAAARVAFRATKDRAGGPVTMDRLLAEADPAYQVDLFADLAARVQRLEEERARE